MVYNTITTIQSQPKLYNTPRLRSKGNCIVCGSGPSLDDSLEEIKELSSSHVIISGGSNYSTLRAYGIVPDFLVLVEEWQVDNLAVVHLAVGQADLQAASHPVVGAVETHVAQAAAQGPGPGAPTRGRWEVNVLGVSPDDLEPAKRDGDLALHLRRVALRRACFYFGGVKTQLISQKTDKGVVC